MTGHASRPRTIVIGAGHAGGRAAEALREADPAREIVLVGREAHPPYERPPLSKAMLAGAAGATDCYLHPVDWYTAHDIDLRLGTEVIAIDRAARSVVLEDGGRLTYDSLLLTTGSRARVLSVPGATEAGVLYLRDIPDAEALADRLGPNVTLAVIGAGFVGLEVAAAARRLGARVHVIELAPQPLSRVVDPAIGRWVGQLHERHGVTLHLGRTVSAIQSDRQRRRILLDDGAAIEVDLIVAGVGAAPNTELAEAAGLQVQDGILTDEQGRTSDPAIRAAGDCTRHFNPLLGRHIRLESWQNAQNQAIAVARSLTGIDHPHAEIPWFWSDQYEVNLQMLGLAEAGAPLIWRGDPATDAFIAFSVQGGRIIAATGANRAKEMAAVRHMMLRNLDIDPNTLADPTIRLTSLLNAPDRPKAAAIPQPPNPTTKNKIEEEIR